MKEKTHALAKLTDIEVGEYNDDHKSLTQRQTVPFSYQSIPDPHRKALEQPFIVYFLEESGQVMHVPQSDVEFVTNIRKSIVEILRVEPILANFGGIKGDQLTKHISDGRAPEAFTVEEESILGRCESEYTLKKMEPGDHNVEKKLIEKHLKKDVQSKTSPRSRTSNIPKLEEEEYILVRTINFDKCKDIVIQQHAGGANMSHEEDSQFRAVHSRSSVSIYYLRGQPGSFRIDLALVEGDVIVNPFGFKTEKLQASTRQVLLLESAQPIRKSLILPRNLRPLKSWRYEVASPHSPPEGHGKQWVNYHNKNDKYYPVSFLSSAGIDFSSQDIQKYQEKILELLDKTVQEFYSEPSSPSPEDPSPKMTKASLATTRLYAMTHLMRVLPIDKIRELFSKTFENRDVDSQRKQTFLTDVAAASGASAPIKVLLEKMEKQEISPERIASIFLTLPNNLYSPSVIPELMEYVKRLNIETNPLLTSSALINFASLAERVCINHKKINYTIPYALFGRENCGPEQILGDFLPFLEEKAKSASKYHERAIYLQAIKNLGSPEIINILKPYIYGKNDKNLHVRSIAIYGLSNLRLPDSAREEVFETLMAVVDNFLEPQELRQVAFRTLVTWHPSASWWQRMASSTWTEFSRNFATFISLTVQSLAKSTEPHLKHQSRIASFVLPLLKPYSPSLHLSYNRIYSRYDPQSKIGLNFDFSTIESRDDSLPFQIHTSLRENFGGLFIHLFENIVLIFLLHFLYFLHGERVIKELLSGVEIHATKYLNPIDLEFFIPTEIGLPLRGQAVMPTVNLGEADVKLVAPGLQNPTFKDLLKHDQLSLRFKSNYKYSSKLIVKLTVLSPLNQKVTEAGVENYSEMNLPFYGDLSLNRSNEIKNISLSVSPHTQQKVRNQFEQSYTGIASEIHYSGDVPYPFTSGFLLDYLRKPEQQGKLLTSPVTKQWQYSISWDPSSSESRNVTLALSYVSVQPSQNNYEVAIPDFSVNDDPQQRLQKLKQISKKLKIHGLNAQLFFNSNDFRRYEIVLGFAQELRLLKTTTGNKKYRMVAAALTSKGTFKISEEREKLISEELYRDPPVEFQTAPVYDVGTLDIEFSKDKIPKSILNASYSLQQFIEGALFPHGYYNNMFSGQPNKIRIETRSPVWSKKYSFSVETPQKHSIFSEIHVPYFATKIVKLTGLQTTSDKITDTLLISIDPYNMCYFRNDSIKTFDRIKYKTVQRACWATLVLNHYNASDFVVRARWDTHGVPQAQLKLPDGTIQIDVDYRKVVINGKEMAANESEVLIRDPSGRIIIIVDRTPDGYKVRYLDRLTIFPYPNEIRIAPSKQINTKPATLRGLCGDYDSSYAYDKTGPKECIYTNSNNDLFQFSWTTTEGDGCDSKEVEQMQSKVHNYQKTCPRRPSNTAEITNAYGLIEDEDCIQLIYPVFPCHVKDNNGWCAAYDPQRLCKEDCFVKSFEPMKLKGGFWPLDDVPPDVQEGEERGYNYQPPAEKAQSYINIYGTEVKDCVKRNRTLTYQY
ncbi:Vitellogenin [Armadillidium vulgare]|nr:Vitellogenin [Armadillidium vulgare]